MNNLSGTKTTKIIYWVGVTLLSLLFLTSGYFEITKNPLTYIKTLKMGYPPYFITLLGISKLAGVTALLIPHKLLWLKDWVFAGLVFDVIFAFASGYAISNNADLIKSGTAFVVIIITYIQFHRLNHLHPVCKISVQ
jgi:membrane protein CcdC involved in cytochrome C biogenesis